MKPVRTFLSPVPIEPGHSLATVRIILGTLLIYHGQEIFHPQIMAGYLEWETFRGSMGTFKAYAGKSSELIAGILLAIGFLTRAGAALVAGTFLYITFFVGEGRFWYEDQHPFMFFLFGVLFLFAGPGKWSVDGLAFRNDPA